MLCNQSYNFSIRRVGDKFLPVGGVVCAETYRRDLIYIYVCVCNVHFIYSVVLENK